MWIHVCQEVKTIFWCGEWEVEMTTGLITRDAVSIWCSGSRAVTQAHPGSAFGSSECNRWQKPEGSHPMVLIFRGLRSALWLPLKPTVCATWPTCTEAICEIEAITSFEVGLYEELIHSQHFTYGKCQSACIQFEEAERSTSKEATQCSAVSRVNRNIYFSHLKKVHTKTLPTKSLFQQETAII